MVKPACVDHMVKAGKIMRKSICTFLQYYHYFTSIPLLLILPFSASILLSQALSFPDSSSPPLLFIQARFNSSFEAIGLSTNSSHFVSVISLNLSQTIFTYFLSLLSSLTSLLIAKALIIQAPIHNKSFLPPFPFSISKPLCNYKPLLLTQLCNSILTIGVNTLALTLLLASLNTLQTFTNYSITNNSVLLFSKTAFYSLLASVGVICDLALVVAGMENHPGFVAIHKACLISWNRNNSLTVLLSMNLPVNLGILAVEGLFGYRIVRAYRGDRMGKLGGASLVLEGLLIAYLHSLLIVLHTIVSCVFFKRCARRIPK